MRLTLCAEKATNKELERYRMIPNNDQLNPETTGNEAENPETQPVISVPTEETPDAEAVVSMPETESPTAETPETQSVTETVSEPEVESAPEVVLESTETVVEAETEAVAGPESPEAVAEEPLAPEAPVVAEEEQPAVSESAPLPVEGVYSTDLDENSPAESDYSDLLARIEEILHEEDTDQEEWLSGASVEELIGLIQHYIKQPNLDQARKRVEVIRKSFHKLDASSLEEEEAAQFKLALGAFDDRLRTYRDTQDQERKANAQKRQALIADLKAVVEKMDATLINEVREIQNSWKTTGPAPRELSDELNSEYKRLLDAFYEQRKLHNEMMEYDHKRNLEEKERILARIRDLVPAPEDREKPEVWRDRQELLNEIRQEWNDAGHVPREEMERINEAFRQAVDGFFEVRQEFMALLEKVKEENAEKKEEILKHMETFREFVAERPREWNQATDQLRILQDTWKTIGPAPKAKNSELWSKYRDVCGAFFNRKSEFFKTFDSERNANLEAKRKLVEQAEVLAESSEWDKAARELQRLQTEWKNVGAVPERFSNKLWGRFRKACDTFFERRRTHTESQRSEETSNLKQKQDIIAALQGFSMDGFDSWDAAKQFLDGLNQQYRNIGHVPYREMNALRDQFKQVWTAANDVLHGSRGPRKPQQRPKQNIEEIKNPEKRNSAIDEQIRRLRRRISQSEETMSQYENNIGMIAKGKSGDPLRATINQRIDQERKIIADLKKEIKELQEMSKRSEEEAEAKALAAIAASEEAEKAAALAAESEPADEEQETTEEEA